MFIMGRPNRGLKRTPDEWRVMTNWLFTIVTTVQPVAMTCCSLYIKFILRIRLTVKKIAVYYTVEPISQPKKSLSSALKLLPLSPFQISLFLKSPSFFHISLCSSTLDRKTVSTWLSHLLRRTTIMTRKVSFPSQIQARITVWFDGFPFVFLWF